MEWNAPCKNEGKECHAPGGTRREVKDAPSINEGQNAMPHEKLKGRRKMPHAKTKGKYAKHAELGIQPNLPPSGIAPDPKLGTRPNLPPCGIAPDPALLSVFDQEQDLGSMKNRCLLQ